MPAYSPRSDMTLHDLAHHLTTAARILTATAKYFTELEKEIER